MRPAVAVADFVAELRDRLAGKEPVNPASKPRGAKRKPQEDQDVKESEARALRAENERLTARIAELEAKQDHPIVSVGGATIDEIIAEFKRRAAKEPELIALLTKKPQIVVTIERPTIQLDGSTLKGRIAKLLAGGFYDNGATNSGTRSELKRTGPDSNNANIGRVLDELLRDGFLTLEAGNSYRAVEGMKVQIVEK